MIAGLLRSVRVLRKLSAMPESDDPIEMTAEEQRVVWEAAQRELGNCTGCGAKPEELHAATCELKIRADKINAYSAPFELDFDRETWPCGFGEPAGTKSGEPTLTVERYGPTYEGTVVDGELQMVKTAEGSCGGCGVVTGTKCLPGCQVYARRVARSGDFDG